MSLQQQIEEYANQISLLLVMVNSDDKTGIAAILELCEQIESLSGKLGGCERIAKSISTGVEILNADGSENFFHYLEKLMAEVPRFFIDASKVKFPNETSSGSNQDLELAAHFDGEFLPDFIEKHSLLLDELEGQIFDFRYRESTYSEEYKTKFQADVRSYLHNIKGDAGAIGISGIEKVTHFLEDLIGEHSVSELLGLISMYKQWVSSCLRAYTHNHPPPEHSSEFIASLRTALEKDLASVSSIEEQPGANKKTSEDLAEEESIWLEDEEAGKDSKSDSENVFAQDEDLEEYNVSADISLFSEFAAEAQDHLNELERIVLASSPSGENLVDEDIATLFRGVHSLKGASSFFNFMEINQTSHVLENLLDEVRGGKRNLDRSLLQLILEFIDLESRLMAKLRPAVENNQPVRWSREAKLFLEKLHAYERGEFKPELVEKASDREELQVTPSVTMTTGSEEAEMEEIAHVSSATEEALKAPDSESKKAKPSARSAKQGETLELKTFVKIDTNRLDQLIDSIGEMVIYSSMLIRQCREELSGQESIIQNTHQVEKFSRELQEIGMSMRLDPIKGLFQKMSRLVWDVSKKLNKDISFLMKGEDTELDRNVIEKLADPLMHMVRNSIDHGIEPPAERLANGKPAKGNIELGAYHAGGSIHVVVKDDGRGLDKQRIRNKAIEKGLISAEQNLTDSEIYNLVFAPGFSTAESVTDISGRGVGMDVVRTNIEGMRGQIMIESHPGKGSTFLIELPLTLAIIDGIETVVGVERFIVPTLSIIELIRPTQAMLGSTIGKEDTFLFRGRFLPMYKLAGLYQVANAQTDPTQAIVVVVESANEQVAIMVDDIVGSCQTVIKSLGNMFKEGQGLAGCAIMPNGDIGLIIDVRSLVQLARNQYCFSAKVDTAAMRKTLFENGNDSFGEQHTS